MASPHDLDLSAELRLIPLLADVAKEALADIVAAATQKRAHAGVALVEQGIASPHLAILVRGAAKVVRTVSSGSSGGAGSSGGGSGSAAGAGAVGNASSGGGNESTIVLDVMRAPCIIADASVLDGQPALASVVTLRSSHAATIDKRSLARLMAAHPSIARALLVRAAQELRSRVRRIDEIVVGPVDERVKHLLDSLAQEHGTPLGQGRFIAIPLRRRDLANMVNATTETVSRLLAKLEREGLARSTRDGIWWRWPPPPKDKARQSSLPPEAPQATTTDSDTRELRPNGDAHGEPRGHGVTSR